MKTTKNPPATKKTSDGQRYAPPFGSTAWLANPPPSQLQGLYATLQASVDADIVMLKKQMATNDETSKKKLGKKAGLKKAKKPKPSEDLDEDLDEDEDEGATDDDGDDDGDDGVDDTDDDEEATANPRLLAYFHRTSRETGDAVSNMVHRLVGTEPKVKISTAVRKTVRKEAVALSKLGKLVDRAASDDGEKSAEALVDWALDSGKTPAAVLRAAKRGTK